MGFGVTFHGPDAVPDAKQKKHTFHQVSHMLYNTPQGCIRLVDWLIGVITALSA